MAEEKMKALEDAFKQIEKQFGKGSIMKLGENLWGIWKSSLQDQFL